MKSVYIGEDGLRYCAKCKEPLEVKCPEMLLGKDFIHSRQCACMRQEQEKSEQLRREQEHKETVSRNRQICFREKRMCEWSFEHSDENSNGMKIAKLFVERWDEMKREHCGLLFWGDVGSGKTYLAACIANALLEQEVKVLMCDFTTISNISLYDIEEYKRGLDAFNLLILDDLGAQRDTKFATHNVYDIINYWWLSGKPLIVTTNMTLEEIRRYTDTETNMDMKRVLDRINDLCSPVLVTGDSKRKESAKKKMRLLESLREIEEN